VFEFDLLVIAPYGIGCRRDITASNDEAVLRRDLPMNERLVGVLAVQGNRCQPQLSRYRSVRRRTEPRNTPIIADRLLIHEHVKLRKTILRGDVVDRLPNEKEKSKPTLHFASPITHHFMDIDYLIPILGPAILRSKSKFNLLWRQIKLALQLNFIAWWGVRRLR
jgi:hypothetical protein